MKYVLKWPARDNVDGVDIYVFSFPYCKTEPMHLQYTKDINAAMMFESEHEALASLVSWTWEASKIPGSSFNSGLRIVAVEEIVTWTEVV